MTTQSFLRSFRKRSHLFLSDIAFLLDSSDYSKVCRVEKGLRNPSPIHLLTYHLLFDTPIENFFSQHKTALKPLLVERAKVLVENLQAIPQNPQTRARIVFLKEAIVRLSAPSV